MKKLLYALQNGVRTLVQTVRFVITTFSVKQLAAFLICASIFIIGALGLVRNISNHFSISVPAYGGTLTEGMVGAPRYVNPVLALSDTDRDLVHLVYSGLVRHASNGEIIPDLAEDWTVSSDGLTYTFTIREHAKFQDGTPVKASDVLFTINKLQDPIIKSPKKVLWEGITVEAPDDRTVVFHLKSRFATFLDNASIGILPEHLWKSLTPEEFSLSELNVSPIGTGPYIVEKIAKKKNGIPSEYELRSYNHFALGRPYIKTIRTLFFANESELGNALENGSIDAAAALSPSIAKELPSGVHTFRSPLPRVFGVFFNAAKNKVLGDPILIKAINLAINRQGLIDTVLGGYGTATKSPVPPDLLVNTEIGGVTPTPIPYDIEQAKTILAKGGYIIDGNGLLAKKDKKTSTPISFTLVTGDAPELKQAAELIKSDLERIGITVTLKVYEVGTLNQTIIRPREYEALFFGQVVTHDTDLFAFWHSSQRNDPGLNISRYANAKVDALLEQAGSTLDNEKRADLYRKFEVEVMKDVPAVFVYSPDFIYSLRSDIGGMTLDHIRDASDRFQDVYTWYINTDTRWPIFGGQTLSRAIEHVLPVNLVSYYYAPTSKE